MIGVYPSRSIPLTNPFSDVANQPFTYRPSIQWTSEEPPAIHQLKSCNYRAVRPKPLPPPSISPFFRREPVRWLLMADSVAGRPNYVKHRLLLVMSPWQVTGRAGQFSSNNTLNIRLDPMEIISFCFLAPSLTVCQSVFWRQPFFQSSQYGIVLIIWGIVLMNLLISNFLSCPQWQWVPSKPVAPSAVFAYLGLSGDICLHYQPSPLFPYVRLTTYRREPKCSSGGKENMKLTRLGDLSFNLDVFTKTKLMILSHYQPCPPSSPAYGSPLIEEI